MTRLEEIKQIIYHIDSTEIGYITSVKYCIQKCSNLSSVTNKHSMFKTISMRETHVFEITFTNYDDTGKCV